MKKLKQKLRSRAGESISETLVAVLISALALVMLAGAMSAATSVVNRSRDKLNEYYNGNETMMESGTELTQGITITEDNTEGSISLEVKCDIVYYTNEAFGDKPVIAYEIKR